MPTLPIMTTSPSVLAVMVNFNGKNYLSKSIPTCLAELTSVGHNSEMLIIDNNSTDESIRYIQITFPEVTVRKLKTNTGGSGGFTAGMKIFLQNKKYDFIWLLDNDIIIEPGALTALLNTMNSSQVGAAGSQICLYDSPDVIQEVGGKYTAFFGALTQVHSGDKRLAASTPPYPVDYLAACSVLIKRECLEQVGYFDDFFISYDDVDWGLRANTAGWKIFAVPASTILHTYNKLKPLDPNREYYRKRNRLIVLTRHPPKRGRFFICFLYLVFLNYRIHQYKWSKNWLFYEALKLSIDHALQGKMGSLEQQWSSTSQPEKLPLPSSNRTLSILIDIEGDAGIIAAIVDELSIEQPVTTFCTRQKKYLSFFKNNRIKPASHRSRHDIVIIGNDFHYTSLFCGGEIYQYYGGNYHKIHSRLKHLLNDARIKFSSLFYSLLISPFHFFKLMQRIKKERHRI